MTSPDADTSTSPMQRLAVALASPTPLVRLVWAALAGVPLLWVVEYTGPRWLNLALRGAWVAAVVAIAALWVLDLLRRRRGRADQDLSR